MASYEAEWRALLKQYRAITKLIHIAYMTPVVNAEPGDYESDEYLELADHIVTLKREQREVKAQLDVALAV